MSMICPGCPSWLDIFERLSVPVITAPNHSRTACRGASPPRTRVFTTASACSWMPVSCWRIWLSDAFRAGRVLRWSPVKCTAFALDCTRLGLTWLSCGLGLSRKPSNDSVCSRNPSPAWACPGRPRGRKTGSLTMSGITGDPLLVLESREAKIAVSRTFISCKSLPAMPMISFVSTDDMTVLNMPMSSSASLSASFESNRVPSFCSSMALNTAPPGSPSFAAPNISGHCTASAT
mmetsp:Transcript_12882/g.29238  ORF Transcript_12882/g.29238 Transcript_12882/m.29238 type:complete len:234 (-) Transcript_12882:379-1080(-)